MKNNRDLRKELNGSEINDICNMIECGKFTETEISRFALIGTGNKKLLPDNNVKYMIFNLPARMTCPYKTEMCSKSCYAIKAETAYPETLPARMRNFRLSQSELFVPYMVKAIHAIAKRPAYKAAKNVFFRIHESGDFYNKKYTEAWIEIMNACKDIKNLQFIAYTKSVRYFANVEIPENFTLRYSIWADTKPVEIAIAAAMGLPIYTAVNELPADYTLCECKNCSTCQKCFDRECKKIACKIH